MQLRHIDAIRGVAVLMVVLVHTAQPVNGLSKLMLIIASYSQMGVQLFFVASAYTLCLSALRRGEERGFLKKYAFRRYFRIAPAYYIALLMYWGLAVLEAYWKNAPYPVDYHWFNILTNVLFLHGFYPSANNNIVPGGWSVGVEMAFYVVFPWLFALFQRWNHRSVWRTWLLVAAGVLVSQGVIQWLVHRHGEIMANNTFLYYSLATQLPVFLTGMAYFYTEKNGLWRLPGYANMLLAFALTCAAFLGCAADMPYLFSLIPTVAAFAYMFLTEAFKKIRWLSPSWLVSVGKVSYSMYLVHFIFAWKIGELAVPRLRSWMPDDILLWVWFGISAFLSYHVAVWSERHIERPFIVWGKQWAERV